jgi:hypothetical protein
MARTVPHFQEFATGISVMGPNTFVLTTLATSL